MWIQSIKLKILFSYSCVVPHSGQNFAVIDKLVPHSEQNFPSVFTSFYAFPTFAELFTAPVGTYVSSSIKTGSKSCSVR